MAFDGVVDLSFVDYAGAQTQPPELDYSDFSVPASQNGAETQKSSKFATQYLNPDDLSLSALSLASQTQSELSQLHDRDDAPAKQLSQLAFEEGEDDGLEFSLLKHLPEHACRYVDAARFCGRVWLMGFKILWNSQSVVGGEMYDLQQVVLQLAWKYIRLAYH
jgi:hypothetical protein